MIWKKVKLGEVLIESKLVSDKPDVSKRITVRLNQQGVEKRGIETEVVGATKQYIRKAGQFIYGKQNFHKGAFGLIPEELDGFESSSDLPSFDIAETCLPEWILYFFKQGNFYLELNKIAKGVATQRINTSELFEIEIPLPSIDIQSEVLNTIKVTEFSYKSLLLEYSSQLSLITKLRQQILQDAIQGKLVPQNENDEPARKLLKKIKEEKERLIKEKKLKKEKPLPPISNEEIPFSIPKNWEWCRLGEICYIASGSTPKKDAFVKTGIPYLKMYNLRNQEIDFEYRPQYIKPEIHEGLLKRSQTEIGDVLMNIVGPPLGKIAMIPPSLKSSNFNQAAVLIRPLLFKVEKLNYWIYWFLRELSEINSIPTKGVAGQDNISVTQSRNMKISLPPLAEQQRIVERVDELMKICDGLEESILKNKELSEKLYQTALKEALQPPKAKVVKLTPTYCDLPKRTILAGYVLNQCHTEDFGRVKFMKLLYLVEHICHLDFNSQYIKKAAGPYDGKLIGDIEKKLNQMQFYKIEQDKKENKKVKYTPLGYADELNKLFAGNFVDEREAIDSLLEKFRNSTWEQTEIIATLYAVWNNRILEGKSISDDLLQKDFLDWDKNKVKYKDRLADALQWMTNNDIIPMEGGYGKIIEKP